MVEVEPTFLHEIERGRRPNYAFIPALADQLLVADFDRVLTVEKSVVADWKRVEGYKTWNAESVELTFCFIRDEDEPTTFHHQRWEEHLSRWLKRVPTSGRFVDVDGVVLTMDDRTAREYLESDPLDVDHLSSSP